MDDLIERLESGKPFLNIGDMKRVMQMAADRIRTAEARVAELSANYRAVQEARDEVGFLGSPEDCIRYLDHGARKTEKAPELAASTIKIYHAPDYMMRNFLPPYDIKDEVLQGLYQGRYNLVATVEADDLNEAHRLTNHIDCSWPMNDKVEAYGDDHRSTSIGDVAIRDGIIYFVAQFGFEIIGPIPDIFPDGALENKKAEAEASRKL